MSNEVMTVEVLPEPEIEDVAECNQEVQSPQPDPQPRLGIRKPLDPQLKSAAKSLFLQGKTTAEISRQTGVNYYTVKTWSRSRHWKLALAESKSVGGHSVTQVAVIAPATDARVEALRSELCTELEAQVAALKAEPIQSAKELASIPGAAGREGRSSVVKRIVDAFEGLYPETKAQGLVLMDLLAARPEEKPAIAVESKVEPQADKQAG